MSKQFEYFSKVLSHKELMNCKCLNEVGQEGWELVQLVHQYGFGVNGQQPSVLAMFKRGKDATEEEIFEAEEEHLIKTLEMIRKKIKKDKNEQKV